VAACLVEPNADFVAQAINLCEIYYQAVRGSGQAAAETAMAKLTSVGVRTSNDFDDALWKQAGLIKGAHRLSLADAIGLALTLRLQGEFVTSDHHELDPIAAAGVCPINFFC
jgi:predicted nucleic acid-binding protein